MSLSDTASQRTVTPLSSLPYTRSSHTTHAFALTLHTHTVINTKSGTHNTVPPPCVGTRRQVKHHQGPNTNSGNLKNHTPHAISLSHAHAHSHTHTLARTCMRTSRTKDGNNVPTSHVVYDALHRAGEARNVSILPTHTHTNTHINSHTNTHRTGGPR